MPKLISKYLIILFIIVCASLMAVVYANAAEITVQVDEKELAGALLSQIMDQLKHAKETIFKYMPDDFFSRITTLGAQMFVLTQQLVERIYTLIINVLQPNNKFGF